MTMSDPIADMFTRIRNAGKNHSRSLTMPGSKIKTAIAAVLKEEGYIVDYTTHTSEDEKLLLEITLKYYKGAHVISKIKRVSRPGLRIYKPLPDLPRVMGGLGIAVVSTPQGVMSDRAARARSLGGEIIGIVE